MIQAGFAKVALGEWVGYRLPGHSAREAPARFSFDRQYVRTVTIRSGTRNLIVVLADVIAVDESLASSVSESVSARTGVDKDEVVLCATHTHTGPPVFELGNAVPEPDARAELVACSGEAAEQAMRNLQLIDDLQLVQGHNPFAVNRRLSVRGSVMMAPNPDLPIDKTMKMVVLKSRDSVVGRLLCLPMHPTVLSPTISGLSGDIAGAIASTLERYDGSEHPSLIFQGASGDIRPLVTDNEGKFTGGDWELVRQMGNELVNSLLYDSVTDKISPGTLLTGSVPLNLDSVEHDHRKTAERLQREIRGLSIGPNLSFVFLPGEPFSGLASSIEACSPFTHTIVLGHTGPTVGYVPTPDEFDRGGYEVNEAFSFYGYSSPLARDSGDRMVQGACNLLEAFHGSLNET